MDIRQLEAYVYTVKYRSFSLAAQKLYLSQPTVSAHICNLEKELHTQLLKRTTKTLSVTPVSYTHLDVYKRQPPVYGVCWDWIREIFRF